VMRLVQCLLVFREGLHFSSFFVVPGGLVPDTKKNKKDIKNNTLKIGR